MNANKLIPFLVCWLLIFGWQMGQAQFERRGTAVLNGPNIPAPPAGCENLFQLTDNVGGQVGAVWSTNNIDLSRSFTLETSMYFGTDDFGADGIAFVLQNLGTGVAGGAGGGLGLLGITPSVAVEFDDYDNDGDGIPDEGPNDHMDIIYNGDFFANPSPFPGNVALPNIEDGNWHEVVIEWNVCTNTGEQCLTVTFDGNNTIQHCDDMINTVLGGNPIATWGFTASTGGASNDQAVCIGEIETFDVDVSATELELCENETSIIDVETTGAGVAELLYVDNLGVANVVPSPFNLIHDGSIVPTEITSDGLSIYRFIGQTTNNLTCNTDDTIVIIGSNLMLQIGHPDTVCEGETINFSANAQGGFRDISNPYTFNWSENGTLLNSSNLNFLSGTSPVVETNIYAYAPPVGNGFLDLEVVDRAGCVANITLPYTVNTTPNVSINTSEDTVCVGEEITLTASPSGAASYDWTPNSLGTMSTVTATVNLFGNNPFSVAVTNANGCQDSTTIDVRGVSCCQVTQNSNDYLRLDPDNPDSRLADYGINQYQNSRFYIINTTDEYQRLPARVYLADEVTLFVRGRGNTLDVTNSDLVFGARAGLYIEDNNELIANNTVFRPCDETQTWDGVVITGDNSVANFRECTFVNPTFGVYYNTETNGGVSNSLFLNAQHGIVSYGRLGGTISNNVFKVDDKAQDLTYSALNSFGNNGAALDLGIYYNTYLSRYNIDHSGVFALADNFNEDADVLISQNEFINAMTLGGDHPTFNGILLASVQGLNISDNSFTNNDMSVLVHYSQDISIENNHMEVTRRSASDASFYQIVTFGPDNSASLGGVTALIKGNTIVNSADQQELTSGVLFESGNSLTPIIGVLGTGAIYSYGNNRTATGVAQVRIEDNDIAGFEIGIYVEQSASITLQIVNNRIKASIYGIYQNASNSFVGCNEIEMDLDANVVPNAGVVGVRSDLNASALGGLEGVAGIFGNCIRNTDRAIFMENNSGTIGNLGWIHIQNNFLYNYTEAGLYAQSYFNIRGLNNQNEPRIRRNAFISNQPNGTSTLGSGAFDIVTDNNIATTNNAFVLDGNYFGAKGMMNVLELGSDPINISTRATQTLKPYATCGNMDATSTNPDDFNPTIEGDWMNRCDDELYGNIGTPIAQRTNTGTQLNATYQTTLSDLMENNQGQAEGLIVAHLQDLTDMVDVEALYLTAQQLSLSTKTSSWVEYYYQERKGNHTAAQQVLNNIETATTIEAEEVTLKKAHLDLKVRNATTLTDATLIAELKEIADRPLGVHKHTARAILHEYTNDNSYTFQYNPVKLYTKSTNTRAVNNADRNTSILITPNPATDKISINIATDKIVAWTVAELYDVHGRLLFSQPVRSYTLSFDVESLTQGVYFITLKGENGDQTTEKFIKQ